MLTTLLCIGCAVALVALVLWSIGPAYSADSASAAPTSRFGKSGELITGHAHGGYYENASRGLTYTTADGTGTAPGTAIGTTAAFTLYNPANSGKRLAIQKVSLGYISGTLGAGTVFHCANISTSQAAPSSGTALTMTNCDLGNAATPVGVARVGGTVASGTRALRPLCSLGASLASTAAAPWVVTEDVNGEIVVEPGTSYQVQGVTAAGSSPLVAIGVTWTEVPIV